MAKQLRDYQVEDLAFYMKHRRWMNLSDPGVGKTPSVCVWFEFLWNKRKVKSAWAMPKSLLSKNKEEIHNFTNFKDEEIIIVDGTPKQRRAQMRSKEGKVWLMGFKRYSDDWKYLLKYHPELNATCVDEIHMGYKGHESERTKSLFRSMRKIKYFGAMSGTIIDGRLDSCYPTIHIIQPRYYANHYAFMLQHAELDYDGKVERWVNHAKIGRIFKKHGIRRKFKDVYGDQKIVIQTDWCDMHPKQAKAYEEFERDAILELDRYIAALKDDILDGTEPGVKTIRCRQLLAHPETFDILKNKEMTGKDEQLLIHAHDHKAKGEPLIVFTVLRPEQKRITKLLEDFGLRVGMINGHVPIKKRNQIDLDFRKGRLDVVVASPETTAVGYNWGHVNHIIFCSIDYKNTNITQGIRRATRGIRKQPLRVTVMAYDCPVERRMFAIVNTKSQNLHKVDNSYDVLSLGT